MLSVSGSQVQPGEPRRIRLLWWVAGSAASVLLIALLLSASNDDGNAQLTGDLAILIASLTATFNAVQAARRGGKEALAWWLLSAALLIWSVGMEIWTFYGITRDHQYPFPSLADLGFTGYAIPAAAALFAFPRPRVASVALWRAVLDAAVIAGSVLYISWSLVLGPVVKAENSDLLSRLTGIAYPVVDIVMTSLVLVFTMRRAKGERLRWLCLGGGLLVLAVTDSIYMRLTFEGVTGVTGTPLAAGWISAFLLIALAPMVPHSASPARDRRAYTLALELLPYLLVAGMVVVAVLTRSSGGRDVPVVVTGYIVLVLVIARQVLIVFENVTLTRGLEDKVAERTAQLEGLGAIVNSSADAIVGKTPDGTITSWNPGAERIYGYSASDVIGRSSDFLIPDHLRESESAILEAAGKGGETRTYETERVRGDGTIIPVSLTISPIRGDSGIHGVATIAQDITERRRSEEELVAAREAALESSRLKSEFLATMSHEIRTPMNGVIGLTALLLETHLDEVQRQYAEGVRGAGESLLSLINDILDFSKLEAGKVDLDLDSFDPRVLVEEVAGLLAESAQTKGLELIAYCRPEVPRRLIGDAGRIRQVLLNLASNAVKFTPAGEVAIKASVTEQADGKVTVRFEVRDTGIGIEPGNHERLFESFSQADASTTRRFGGTGLGLAICQRLTEAMDGKIGLDSALGEGSTFWFSIPLPISDSATAAPAPAADLLAGLKVLVVDDNATNRLVLESQLAGWKMRPDSVEGGPQGLGQLHAMAAAGKPYQIAVLDMCMPQMDGVELARQIRRDESLRDLRIIMLTSTMQVSRTELLDAGVQEWLTKPVRSSEFFDRLMRLMASPSGAMRVPERPTAARKEAQDAHRGRILVVEDNEVNQLVARSMVARLGFDVDLVTDGSQAVSAAAAGTYAAVLMDCHMPVMDGFEATRAIRSGQESGSLPIIAMTAGALDEDRERCFAAGMDDYLTKPLDLARLEEVLDRWIPPAPVQESSPPREVTLNGQPSIDPVRLAVLRELGPADGRGLLPAAAEAFREGLRPSLQAIREALDDGGGALKSAAHKLHGAAANIGASRAAELCRELERLEGNPEAEGPALVDQLEAELALVDRYLEQTLSEVS